MNLNNYKGLDLSQVSVFDIAKKFPKFAPVLISPLTEMTEDKLRIFSILVYAENYKILDLQKIL